MPAPNNTEHTRRSPLHLLLAFIAGMAICGLIVGGIALLRPQSANSTAPVALGSGQPDSCDVTFNVVASVNQWGSLAQQLGGSCAAVTSLINSTSADPHDYEPTPADLAKLSRADIVVLNGAGYDGWAEKAQLNANRQHIVNVASLMASPLTTTITQTTKSMPATITADAIHICGSVRPLCSKHRRR